MWPAGSSKLNETTSAIEDLDEQDPPYKAYTGIDYGPLQVPAPKTNVTNITGIFVETPLECAVRCNDEDLCNAASYYGNNPVGSWPGGLTCWLKTLAVPCNVPADYQASDYADTIFLVAQDEDYCGAPPLSMSRAYGGPSRSAAAFHITADTPCQPHLIPTRDTSELCVEV